MNGSKEAAQPQLKLSNLLIQASSAYQEESSTATTNPFPKTGSIATNNEVNIFTTKNSLSCVRCKQINCVRIKLRQCGHISCVACLLEHLKYWIRDKSKARLKCIKGTCPIRIHENDINAILDEEEVGLNHFMPLDHRQWLQYYHNKDNIYYALGGNEFVKQCPLCKSMYTEKSGCNFVTCANLRCRTQFCWECNAPIKDISHFAGSKCHVGYEDIIRSLFYIKAAIDIKAFAVALAIPLALFSFMCGLPIFIVFAFPSFLVQRIYKSATRNTDSLTLPEWGLLLFKMISLWIMALPVGLLMGVNSMFTGFVMFILYIVFTIIKIEPHLSKILEEYDKILPMAQRFGIGPFKQMLKDGKEAKKRREKHLDEYKS